jgi:hypothetical protein
MESSCLFCLEAVQENATPNPLGCRCKIHAHSQCFRMWFEQKQQMECPICHLVSVPNRLVFDDIHIVYINTTEQQRVQNRFRQQEKIALFCCCLFLGWTLGITILELIVSP